MIIQCIRIVICIGTSSLALGYFLLLRDFNIKKVPHTEVSNNLAEEPNKELEFSGSGLKQSDPKLIQIIREKLLFNPPNMPQTKARNQRDPSQYGQGELFVDLFNGIKDGFFVEAGATNRFLISNTVYIEKMLNWTGLLVEPSESFFTVLRTRGRNAYLFNGCLALETKASVVKFFENFVIGGINPHTSHNKSGLKRMIHTKSVPTYSLLKAIDNPTVQLFSLDVEGSEPEVLNTIPWSEVDIHIWLIAYGGFKSRLQAIVPIMLNNNYELIGTVVEKDFVFVRNDIKQLYALEKLRNHDNFIPVTNQTLSMYL